MSEFTEKLKAAIKGRVVVYIDAANLERSIKDMFVRPDDVPDILKHKLATELAWTTNYKKLSNFFKSISNCSGIRFYTAEFA
ncbi:MAG: hypothetical protein G01um101470_663, partial [Parcubacteria group bacterium Gr01-1014_70]